VAHRQLGQVGVAWQFGAEDPAVLAAGFAELAAQLGAAEGGDPVAQVHGVLAASPAPWLLLFDNAPDRASVARFVPPAGPGLVLVTSRNPNWPSQALEVPVLDPLVAGEFLVSRTGDADRRAALELAGVLGGLPLALEQAAAYVQASGESMAGYASLFGQRRADLTGRGEPTGSSQTVATTWRLAFEDLNQGATGATGLLRLLAFCAPEAVPLRLLLQPAPASPRSSVRMWLQCWCRCWRTGWRPMTRSWRCAGIHSSPRPTAGRCRCTGLSRPSPPIRCPRTRPGNGGRPPRH